MLSEHVCFFCLSPRPPTDQGVLQSAAALQTFFFPVSNVGQLTGVIFQNQGFDRLSEFPKIRDAIIVFTDGCRGLVDLKLY